MKRFSGMVSIVLRSTKKRFMNPAKQLTPKINATASSTSDDLLAGSAVCVARGVTPPELMHFPSGVPFFISSDKINRLLLFGMSAARRCRLNKKIIICRWQAKAVNCERNSWNGCIWSCKGSNVQCTHTWPTEHDLQEPSTCLVWKLKPPLCVCELWIFFSPPEEA